VRVRIAPSPTGDPHVGTAYIALFNYVFARKHGGKFILRIEDTDQTRSTRASEEAILRALSWVGLQWDEGPDIGGPCAPYRQSERTEHYKRHAHELVERGAAYPCFATADELEAMRKEQIAAGKTPQYDRRYRSLSKEEAKARIDRGDPYVIRLAMPLSGQTRFVDGLRGEIVIENATIDDQVLLKSDGFPTYHLANVVDDHMMGISHVIRAEEWIISTPKHIQLYRAFGWEPPQFLHMPLLRNPDKSKISKRKNPVSLDYYRDAGYFPEALLNFLALMGFAFGGDREKFTLGEMIEVFDFAKVSPGEPVFDLQKLSWLNGLYLREMGDAELVRRLREWRLSDDYLLSLMKMLRERMERLDQFIPAASFFLTGDLDYSAPGVLDLLVPKGRDRSATGQTLGLLCDHLEETIRGEWSHDALEASCRSFCEKTGWKTKELFMPIRVAVTGRTASPGLFDTLAAVGKDLTRRRLRQASLALLTAPAVSPPPAAAGPAAPPAAGKGAAGAGKPAAATPAKAAAAASSPAAPSPAPAAASTAAAAPSPAGKAD
jgi:glutamyl-tRNA synthetase